MKQRSKKDVSPASGTQDCYHDRYAIIKTLALLQQALQQREVSRAELVADAADARATGQQVQYSLLKEKLRLCLANIKMLRQMCARLEISLQLNEMNRLIESYNACMAVQVDRCQEAKKQSRPYAQQYRELSEPWSGGAEEELCALISEEELQAELEGVAAGWQGGTPANQTIDDKLQWIKRKLEGE